MPKPMMRIHNTETNEIIDREMTNEEFAKYQADIASNSERFAQMQSDADAKAALLNRLGITDEEARLLLS